MDVGFVLSSRLETISFACREMMAAGKPVIVSDTGGLAENVTEGGNGWIVPVSAPPRVAETLAEILENRILLDWMAAAARRRAVRDFPWRPLCARPSGSMKKPARCARRACATS
ncbi:glycosyltransferase [Achromobacter insuavis]